MRINLEITKVNYDADLYKNSLINENNQMKIFRDQNCTKQMFFNVSISVGSPAQTFISYLYSSNNATRSLGSQAT